MVFQVCFMDFGWFSCFFNVVTCFLWFLVGFHNFQGSFMVFTVFGQFSWLFKAVSWFSWAWLVFMVYQGSFMVFV